MGLFEDKIYLKEAAVLSQQEKVSLFIKLVDSTSQLERICFDCAIAEGVFLGIASGWSRDDIQLLDLVLECNPNTKFIVFDFTELNCSEEIINFFDGNVPLQTPIYGYRADCVWSFLLQGFKARELIMANLLKSE